MIIKLLIALAVVGTVALGVRSLLLTITGSIRPLSDYGQRVRADRYTRSGYPFHK